MDPMMPGLTLSGPNNDARMAIARQAKVIAPGRVIDRYSLLRLVDIYERTLAPLGSDAVACTDERVIFYQKLFQIAGDNRHLPDTE